jgi:hypothetical protein
LADAAGNDDASARTGTAARFCSETLQAGEHLNSYGAGKGVEFIPTDDVELFIGIAPRETRTSNAGASLGEGWGDWTPFVLKYWFASANADEGNYAVSGLLQLTAPTGAAGFSNRCYVMQPALAFGKGWAIWIFRRRSVRNLPPWRRG